MQVIYNLVRGHFIVTRYT